MGEGYRLELVIFQRLPRQRILYVGRLKDERAQLTQENVMNDLAV